MSLVANVEWELKEMIEKLHQTIQQKVLYKKNQIQQKLK